MNLKKTKERVRKFLEKNPHLRDNDNALVAYILNYVVINTWNDTKKPRKLKNIYKQNLNIEIVKKYVNKVW